MFIILLLLFFSHSVNVYLKTYSCISFWEEGSSQDDHHIFAIKKQKKPCALNNIAVSYAVARVSVCVSGIVLICTVLTNALVLICIVAAHMSQMGMSAMGMGGTSFIDTITPFEGTELQKVRELDMQYGQMRAPLVYGGVAFSLTFGILSLLFVVSGSKPAHILPRKLLIGQFAFLITGAVAYVVAVGLYLHFVIYVNSTDMCRQRERLYARNGYTWMNCSVNGGDASVALFGIITAILYAVGAFLTGKTVQDVRNYFKERDRYKAERREQTRDPQERTLNPDIYV